MLTIQECALDIEEECKKPTTLGSFENEVKLPDLNLTDNSWKEVIFWYGRTKNKTF